MQRDRGREGERVSLTRSSPVSLPGVAGDGWMQAEDVRRGGGWVLVIGGRRDGDEGLKPI